MNNQWLYDPIAPVDSKSRKLAIERQNQLTKPPGSLGQLEQVAIQLAAIQGQVNPHIENVHIAVFAGDHGVVEEGISAFPQSVTVEMVKNFVNGGAAISVLAKKINATLDVVNMGTVNDPGDFPGVISKRIAPGTANFCRAPAMSETQFSEALLVGQEIVKQADARIVELFVGGEMGIGNTTSASAIACALLNKPGESLAGPGTGLDTSGVIHKAKVINSALAFHKDHLEKPEEILRRLGGLEIAALTGAYITCAQLGIASLVDGFISSVAALTAIRIQPECRDWLILAHTSAEPGHAKVIEAIGGEPLLNLGMRLGEGSGAATAVPILQLACALHAEMATFEEANVSNIKQ